MKFGEFRNLRRARVLTIRLCRDAIKERSSHDRGQLTSNEVVYELVRRGFVAVIVSPQEGLGTLVDLRHTDGNEVFRQEGRIPGAKRHQTLI